MMPSLAEVFFNCPLCEGPLIAWETDAGRATDCPHCLKQIAVPAGVLERVDKSTFCEPLGLRRILQEVRDSEWELMRRKLQETRAKVTALEAELHLERQQSALVTAQASGHGSSEPGEFAALRQELIAVTARWEEARKGFAATRQQQEVALDRMREKLEEVRAEVGPLREENAERLRCLTAVEEELEKKSRENRELREQLERRKARTSGWRSNGLAAPSSIEQGPRGSNSQGLSA